MIDDIREFVDQEENEQLRSIPAQRLIEKLSLIKNRVQNAHRRWFWELLQNASDYNEHVNVKLVVNNDSVTFFHDGEPFSIRDALNLISPDSNKTDDTKHIDNIGKFGTGLVSTHILSSVMDVKGICTKDGRFYHFGMTLDRSCFLDKKELINQITSAKDSFKSSLIETSLSKGYNTSFSYQLGRSLPTLKSVSKDDIEIGYLKLSLPYTLCFMPKIVSVNIEDRVTNVKYSIERIPSASDTISFKVNEGDASSRITFAYFKYNNVSTVFQIEGKSILPFPDTLSRIFCGLPLIGTEEIGMPFLLNSLKFEPTTEREGVELEPNSNEVNRSLFKDSIELYKKVLDYVESNKLHSAFNITRIKRKYNGTQASNQVFYAQYMAKYQQEILSHAIAFNAENEQISVANLRLPYREGKPDTDLYKKALMVASYSLPQENDFLSWFNATDFSVFKDQEYTYSHLAKTIESKQSIYSFGEDVNNVKLWLKGCSEYFKDVDRYVFSKFKLLPNQLGTLCNSSELKADALLPEELKAIYDDLLEKADKKVEEVLLDKMFNSLELMSSDYTIEQLAKAIDNELANQYASNQGDTRSISNALNALYTWMEKAQIKKEDLASWFHWYYPKRATLIVDLLSEAQREQALTIAQSGKMDALAKLAVSDLTSDDYTLLLANIDRLPAALRLLASQIDDRQFADLERGEIGEEIVYKDLLLKFPRTKGFQVIWASRDKNEPCYDFEILKDGATYCYCDAKTTSRGASNSDSIPFFMRKSQWDFLNNLEVNIPYLIARVFMGDGGKIKYLRIGLGGR